MREQATEILAEKILSQYSEGALWQGYLSSSAVSTATASFALLQCKQAHPEGARWLIENVNEDGAWGDTPESPSNMSATLLSYATLFAYRDTVDSEAVRQRADVWLKNHLGHSDFVSAILEYYGKDLTFSVPILVMCSLAGLFEKEENVWKRIPRLPFSLALLPRHFFTLINISVVSYALPALIAVGLLQYRALGKKSSLKEKIVIPRVLKKLVSMMPESGGFLEAAPLTAFVSMCLHAAGCEDFVVTEQAVGFLKNTVREDGSWPIDTNLSTWLSSLAIKALVENKSLSEQQKEHCKAELLNRQCMEVHPFTMAEAGGWAWTNLSGGVPDADDTSAALVSLHMLDAPYSRSIEMGLMWLIRLMNKDGGVPTFCRGWGFLPFDRSCPDISAHALRAFALWRGNAPQPMQKRLNKAIARLLRYLEKQQDAEGAWSPLWFGSQDVEHKQNRVWGTAVVLEHLGSLDTIQSKPFVQRAVSYLQKAQLADGMWGGDLGSNRSNIECSARAIKALSYYAPDSAATEQLASLVVQQKGMLDAAPIGLYFAKLWYDEKLYPLIFTLSALTK